MYPVRKTNTENNETEESIIITDQSFREWTDTSGKKLELKLIAIKGDTARFKLRDGRKAKMKIKMLCQEDQEILKRLWHKRRIVTGQRLKIALLTFATE